MGLSSRKLVESRGSEQNCMKISQGFASLWYGHANMAFKASSALPECRQTPHRWPAFLRYCSSFAQQILVEVFHGRISWQLEKVNLSIFVVYCDVCLVAKFRINPTAFCVNVSPSTFPVVREIFLRLLVAERYSICLYIKMLSGSLPTKGYFLAIEFVFR